MNIYNRIKDHEGKKYSGMKVGGAHEWNYPNAKWFESKVEPDRWKIRMTSLKERKVSAPEGSGVPVGTEYNWFIIGHQVVKKTSSNTYETELVGTKYKLGHKRSYWKSPSYDYKEQKGLVTSQIEALEREIKHLKKVYKQELEEESKKLGEETNEENKKN